MGILGEDEPHMCAVNKSFPCALLTGSASRLDAAVGPLVPAQLTRVTALAAPAVTLMATNLLEQARAGGC